MIKNLPIISPFARKRRVTGPPEKAGIDRWFKTREDSTLIDSASGRDATALWPVSSFNGVDGNVLIDNIVLTSWDVSFEVIASGNPVEPFLFILGNNTKVNRSIGLSHTSDNLGEIFFRGEGNVFYTSNINISEVQNESAIIRCTYDGSVLKFYKNSIETSSENITNQILDINSIGSGYNGGINSFTGNAWNININNELLIPLPHTGYGIDQNGNGVQLTVSGGVTEDYDENGSKWLVEKGAVARNPELVVNGDFTNGETGWVFSSQSSIINNAARIQSTDGSYQYIIHLANITSIGAMYELTYEITENNAGLLRLTEGVVTILDLPSEVGVHTIKFTTNTTEDLRFGRASGITDVSITNISIKSTAPDYIPNNLNGQPLFPLVVGDTYISPTGFINATPFMVDMSRPNGAEAEEVVNGGFDTDSDWIKVQSTISGGKARVTSTDGSFAAVQQAITGVNIGDDVIISVDINIISNQASFGFSGDVQKIVISSGKFVFASKNIVSKNVEFKRTGVSFPIDFELDNVSIKLATPEILFFDKSDATIWKQSVRDSIYYDANNPFLWHSSELTQEFIWANIEDAEKYKWWIRLVSNQYKDLFFYTTALSGDDICRAKKYVTIGETITDLTGMESDILCNNDILKE